VKQPADFRIGSILKRTCSVFAPNFFNLAGFGGIAVATGFIVPARDGCASVNLGGIADDRDDNVPGRLLEQHF
jgi:hypothetical protein